MARLFQASPRINASKPAFLAGLISAAVIGVATFVVELVSHFRASNMFVSSWFRRAAWMRITAAAFVAALAGVAVSSPAGLGLSTAFLIPFTIVAVLAAVFSSIAFFKLPEDEPRHYSP